MLTRGLVISTTLLDSLHGYISPGNWENNSFTVRMHFTSKSSTMKIERVHKAALRVVYNDYTTSGNKPLPEPILTQIYVAKWRH